MRFTCIVIAGLLLVVLATGCVPVGEDASATYDQRAGRRAALAAVGAIGGLEAWQNVATVRATALVTLYDKSGTAYVELALDGDSAEETEVILIQILEQFRQDMDEHATNRLRRALQALQDQRHTIDRELAFAQDNLAKLQQQLNQ